MANVKLNFVIVCDDAYIHPQTKSLYINGIFTQIAGDKFPAIHPKFMVITNISGDVGEYDQRITIRPDRNNTPIAEAKGKLKIEGPKQKAQFLATFYNIKFEEGEYKIEVYIDDVLQDLTNNFYVRRK